MKKLTAVALISVISVTGLSAIAAQDDMERPAVDKGASQLQSIGMHAIARAAEADKYLFVFFHNGNDENTQKMREVFDAAVNKAADRTHSVEINVSDSAEKEIVGKFGADRAPMPLVLALAPNGAVTRGFTNQFSEQQLAEAFASPCMERILKAVQERKLVLLCVHNEGTMLNIAAMRGVEEFKGDARFTKATEIIDMDPADAREKNLLAQMKIDPKVKEATTVFLAPPGTIIGKFSGATDKDKLVTTLMAAMSSCASGCGPSGCAPR